MRATINGTTIHYDDHGHGPAVVLIHDFPLNRRMWQPQVEALASAGFRVITPDLRGFGESELRAGNCAIDTYSADMVGLLNYLGIGRAVFCGLSLGGTILFDLLENHPQRVAGACLVSTRPVADDSHERARRGEFLSALDRGQIEQVRSDLYGMLVAGREERLPRGCREQILRLTRDASADSLTQAILAITRRKDYTFQLPRMTVPTLVIGAEQDRITHPRHAELMARQLPNCYKTVKLDCGHLVNLEKVQAFNAHLIDFLASLVPRTRRDPELLQPAV